MYHVNPQTGNPGKCRAKNSCPFGDFDTEHYATRDSARAAYENKQAGAFGDGVVQVVTPDGERFDLDTRKFINADTVVKGRASNLDRAAILSELNGAPDLAGYESPTRTAQRFKAWYSGAGVTRDDYENMWDVLHDVREGATYDDNPEPHAKALAASCSRLLKELENEWQDQWD